MQEILLVLFFIISLALIAVILLQQGKGAGMGASFGGGASGTVFGATGSGGVMTRITTGLAIAFFIVALILGYLSSNQTPVRDEIFDAEVPAVQTEIPFDNLENSSDIPLDVGPAPASDIPTEEAPVIEASQDEVIESSTPIFEEEAEESEPPPSN